MIRILQSRPWFVAVLLVFLSSLSIVSTYSRLSHTNDEPAHLFTGMEWWEKHRYTYETLHPPLARLMAASLIYMTGSSLEDVTYHDGKPSAIWFAGLGLLGSMPDYVKRLFLMRFGLLPFYILSCVLVYQWSRRLYGEMPAFASLALYVSLPTLLAHAGLATTDIAGSAMLLAGIMASLRWLKNPSVRNALLAGATLALMLGSKFSNVFFWPVIMGVIAVVNYAGIYGGWQRAFHLGFAHLKTILDLAAACALVLGALYFFNPAPFVNGIESLLAKNRIGHAIYLFRPLNNTGVWYFFPVLYVFKTPLLFLFCNAVSAKLAAPRGQSVERLFPLIAALVVFLISMPSNINLGVRHVMPVYLFLAIPAGYVLVRLWGKRFWRPVIAVLLALNLVDLARYYPDRVAYYNQLAHLATSGHPERISYDSDFDWGQQYLVLRDAVETHHITVLHLCLRSAGLARNMKDTLGGIKLHGCPTRPVTGWIVTGRAFLVKNADKIAWLQEHEPVEKIGPTLYLYHIE